MDRGVGRRGPAGRATVEGIRNLDVASAVFDLACIDFTRIALREVDWRSMGGGSDAARQVKAAAEVVARTALRLRTLIEAKGDKAGEDAGAPPVNILHAVERVASACADELGP